MKRFFLLMPLLATLPGASAPPLPRPPAPQDNGMSFGPPAPERPKPMGASEAVALALADAQKLSPYDRNFVRYLWCPDGKFKPANLALNVVSRGVAVVRAVPLGGGKLVRVDARLYARFDPNSADGHNPDIDDFLRTWEELRYDPTFSLLITRDNVKFAGQEVTKGKARQVEREVEETEEVLEDCAPYVLNGEVYTRRWVKRKTIKKVLVEEKVDFDVLRYNPDYLDPQLTELQKLLYTEAPIVLDNYFAARALHTVKNDKLLSAEKNRQFQVIWGGLYYEFRGLRRSEKASVTDEDLFLEQFGILGGAAKFFDSLQTDQRAAMWISGVTGRPRRVDFFNTAGGKAWNKWGLGSITHDILDRSIDIGTHPIMNLLKFQDDAREAIFTSPNGLHTFAIFDGAGKLLDEADIHAVSDRTVPSPHPPVLQCAMSCIACHQTEGSDGWKAVKNDVKALLDFDRIDPLTRRPQLRPDIIADLTARDQVGAINRIAGLYAGDFSEGIRVGRNQFANAVLQASGPQGDDQLRVVKTGMGDVVNRTRAYIYGPQAVGIDARQALWELGMEPRPVPTETLRALLPPEPAALGFHPEDPRVLALLRGQSIPRTDMAFVFSYMASRVHKHKAGEKK